MPEDRPRLIAGAMSGTSADGVDVALTRITGRGLGMSAHLIHHHAHPYPSELRQRIFALRSTGATTLSDLATLARDISLQYATAVNDCLRAANVSASDLTAIAAHGQTLFHDPPNTIQWLDPALVAARVGAPVVSDFRRADCAAGGQGAPLVPFADYILFRHPTRNRVLLNIGGIANITYVPANATLSEVIAFDTGPGNCVLDHLARRERLPDGFDRDGAVSQRGQVNHVLLTCCVRPYMSQRPPKSTDAPAMIQDFERADAALRESRIEVSFEDQMATMCRVTATHIRWNIRHFASATDEVIASGGGTRNPVLMRAISAALHAEEAVGRKPAHSEIPVRRIEEFGIPSPAKEALAFALLAAATLDNEPSNVPSATGASRAVVLGSITSKP